jgi:hypothetical protein
MLTNSCTGFDAAAAASDIARQGFHLFGSGVFVSEFPGGLRGRKTK